MVDFLVRAVVLMFVSQCCIAWAVKNSDSCDGEHIPDIYSMPSRLIYRDRFRTVADMPVLLVCWSC